MDSTNTKTELLGLVPTTNCGEVENRFNEMNLHLYRIYETAQKTLAGLLSGPNLNLLVVNAMQGPERMTLGQILVAEAWDMAECLVEKYEAKLSNEATKHT